MSTLTNLKCSRNFFFRRIKKSREKLYQYQGEFLPQCKNVLLLPLDFKCDDVLAETVELAVVVVVVVVVSTFSLSVLANSKFFGSCLNFKLWGYVVVVVFA